MRRWKVLHLFGGMGGGALGFKRAGYESVGTFDNDPAAVADCTMLTGEQATVADLATMSPAELAAACTGRPDVVFTSPPCKGFSGCLPAFRAKSQTYQSMNSLALRGIWLALEAWPKPPAMLVLENVPRIMSRGRQWLDQAIKLLHAYGYAVRETTHDCGELGGLAQRRRRFLLVARHMEEVPEFLYEPPPQPLLTIGDVFSRLPTPLPGSTSGGPMHRLPRLSPMNWLRLALIPAGGDWRDLPESVALAPRTARQNGGFGVNDWSGHSHTVVGEGTVRNTWASTTDPRLDDVEGRYRGGHGVERWTDSARTVIGAATASRGSSVADPRLDCSPRNTTYGMASWSGESGTVVGAARHDNGAFAVTDPRLDHTPRKGDRAVQGWDSTAQTVIGADKRDGAATVQDPRVTCSRREGSLGVRSWDDQSAPVIAAATHHNWPAGVAEPRLALPTHELDNGVLYGPPLKFETRSAGYVVIRAADGTWHRPMTTLELAALQGFPTEIDGRHLVLAGRSHKDWRQRIGNAVPPPAAQAIAMACAATLQAAADGAFLMSALPVWVAPNGRRSV